LLEKHIEPGVYNYEKEKFFKGKEKIVNPEMRSSLVAAAQNKVKETEMSETVVNCRWEKQIDEHRYRVNVKAEMKKDLAAKKIEKELIDVETKQHDTNVMRVI
jgi:hypothetical protein